MVKNLFKSNRHFTPEQLTVLAVGSCSYEAGLAKITSLSGNSSLLIFSALLRNSSWTPLTPAMWRDSLCPPNNPFCKCGLPCSISTQLTYSCLNCGACALSFASVTSTSYTLSMTSPIGGDMGIKLARMAANFTRPAFPPHFWPSIVWNRLINFLVSFTRSSHFFCSPICFGKFCDTHFASS